MPQAIVGSLHRDTLADKLDDRNRVGDAVEKARDAEIDGREGGLLLCPTAERTQQQHEQAACGT